METPDGIGALEAMAQVPIALLGGIVLGVLSGVLLAYIAKIMSPSAPTVAKTKVLKASQNLLKKKTLFIL